MAGPVRIAILANASQAKREFNDVAATGQSRLGKLGGFARGAGLAVAGGLALGGAAAVKFGASAVKSASDAQQSIGATETVFGKFSKTVISTSKAAASQYGLSANEYRENANLLGSLFKGQGVSVDQLAGKTKTMIGTAADLSATFGGTTKEAVEALGSAFKGEFDPLERYGVSIKQSDINARLAAKGQSNLTGKAAKQAQQIAATELIMKQANQTQGAFGRESNTLAHQQQVLGAKWENLKATIGAALLPVLTKLATFVSDRIIPGIVQLWTNIQPAVARFRELFSSAGQGQGIFSTLMGVFARVGGFIFGTLVPAFAAFYRRIAVSLLPIVQQLVTTFQTRVLPTLIRVWPQVRRVATTVAQAAAKFVVFAATVAGRVLPPLIRLAGFIFSKVVPAAVKLVSANVKVISIFVRVVVAIVKAVGAFVRFGVAVVRAIAKVIGAVARVPGKILGVFGRAGSLLVGIGRKIIGGLIDGIKSMFGNVQSTLGGLTSKLTSWKGPPKRDAKLLTPAGESIIQSLIDGFDRKSPAVRKALGVLSRDISTFDASPTASVRLSAASAYASQQSAGAAPMSITITLTADQVSAIERGKRATIDIDAYRAAGGRRLKLGNG